MGIRSGIEAASGPDRGHRALPLMQVYGKGSEQAGDPA
jgi:hypothetical protein